MRVGTREVSHRHPVPEDHIPVSLRRRCGGECVRPQDVARSINRNGRAIRDVFCRGSGDQPLSGRRTRDLRAFDQYAARLLHVRGARRLPSLSDLLSGAAVCNRWQCRHLSDVSHEEGAAGSFRKPTSNCARQTKRLRNRWRVPARSSSYRPTPSFRRISKPASRT